VSARGKVVHSDGKPVARVTVHLSERTLYRRGNLSMDESAAEGVPSESTICTRRPSASWAYSTTWLGDSGSKAV
jgi:hypothetical protein